MTMKEFEKYATEVGAELGYPVDVVLTLRFLDIAALLHLRRTMRDRAPRVVRS